jgi:hypothetical protein
MAKSVTVSGAQVKLLINDIEYGQAQSIQYTIDTADQEIYGIDSIFPQEIAPVRSQVYGAISGIKVANFDLQSMGIRDNNDTVLGSGYSTIRLVDRKTGKNINNIPTARISNEQFSVSAKGTAKISFNFRAILAIQSGDKD